MLMHARRLAMTRAVHCIKIKYFGSNMGHFWCLSQPGMRQGRSTQTQVPLTFSSCQRPYLRVRRTGSYITRSANDGTESDSDSVVPEDLIAGIINSNPETIQRITDAASRVAELQVEQQRLQKELELIDPESDQAMREKRAEAEAAELIADAEVQAAQLMVKAAELARAEVNAERKEQIDAINKIESVKAGVFSAVGGSLATLPFFFSSADEGIQGKLDLLANFAVVAVCSFLFGVVYRYAVRGDKNNSQLKGGVIGAFGLTRGLSLAQVIASSGTQGYTNLPDTDVLVNAAVSMGQSMILFGFCSVALEYAASKKWVEIDAIDS